MDISTTTVTIRENDCELKNCCIADTSGTITLSLWDSQIDQVEEGKSYIFTNLSTRRFNDKTTLTTTRSSTITPLHKKITTCTTDDIQTPPPTLHTVKTDITGASINIKKQCPKCHTPQQTLSTKDKFHRCGTCKILRKGTSYITKCSGFLTILDKDKEISLLISNSLLTKFVNKQKDVNTMDNQDIEEFFMTYGPITITYTEHNQIIDLQTETANANTPQHNDTDDELTAVVVEVHEDDSKTQKNEYDISESEQSIALAPQVSTHDHIKKNRKSV